MSIQNLETPSALNEFPIYCEFLETNAVVTKDILIGDLYIANDLETQEYITTTELYEAIHGGGGVIPTDLTPNAIVYASSNDSIQTQSKWLFDENQNLGTTANLSVGGTNAKFKAIIKNATNANLFSVDSLADTVYIGNILGSSMIQIGLQTFSDFTGNFMTGVLDGVLFADSLLDPTAFLAYLPNYSSAGNGNMVLFNSKLVSNSSLRDAININDSTSQTVFAVSCDSGSNVQIASENATNKFQVVDVDGINTLKCDTVTRTVTMDKSITNGDVLINATNSATKFQILDNSTVNCLTADTTTNTVTCNNLEVTGNFSAPVSTNIAFFAPTSGGTYTVTSTDAYIVVTGSPVSGDAIVNLSGGFLGQVITVISNVIYPSAQPAYVTAPFLNGITDGRVLISGTPAGQAFSFVCTGSPTWVTVFQSVPPAII